MSARIRLRPRIRLLPIAEKKLILGDKKHFEKTSLFQEIKKTFSQPCFYFACFFVALINFFKKKGQKFFISSSSLTF